MEKYKTKQQQKKQKKHKDLKSAEVLTRNMF